MARNTETLIQYKERTGKHQARKGRQPASYVPPKYSKKPKDEQVMTGLYGVDEVKFTDGSVAYVCVDDEIVFENVNSAAAHRSAHGRARNKLLAQEEAAAKSEEEATAGSAELLPATAETVNMAQWFLELGFSGIPEYDELIKWYMKLWEQHEATRRELKNCREEYHALAGVAEQNLELHKTVEQYASELFPPHLRIKFIEMMAEAMENVGDKWLEIVQANREHNKKLKDIIES